MSPFVPHRYRVHIRPDLEQFTFHAQVAIDGVLDSATDNLHLHARDLVVEGGTLRDARGDLSCTASAAGEDRLTVTLPRPASGPVQLTLTYRGTINNAMAGFYRSRRGSGAQQEWLALTQFQESDARRALPCVDAPAAKAVFEVELDVAEGTVALSNTPVVEEVPLPAGRRLVRFQPTPKMSTYLLFFAVGPFRLFPDREDPRVRVVALPGVPEEHTVLGLEFGRDALRFCEEYFRVPYPLEKMDLIAVPDFAFGAMENWGAITFRENLLLQVPGVTSRLGEERIGEVVAHEVAHQWFGNLVTPSDWQYLWLNESFATYFAYKVLDARRPAWQVWQPFLLGQTEMALERDELRCSFAIEMPGDTGRRVAITESTAPIIYSKGGSILRQVEGYVGPAGFRDGLTTYLERHAYGNATSHHLWDALGEAAAKPVAAMMRDWVEQPGHPLVEATRRGNRLHLRQSRFTLLPGEDAALWRVPVRVSAFLAEEGVEERELLLESSQAELELPPGTEAYKVNAGQTGFYRVRYADPGDRDALGPRIRAGGLAPADRWGLHSDLGALLLAGRVGLEEYLTFLAWYDREDELLPMGSLARNLRHLHRVLPAEPAARVAAVGGRLLQLSLERLGTLPRDGEPHGATVLRDQILWDAAVFGSPGALDAGVLAFARLRADKAVPADVVKSSLQVGAWTASEPAACLAWLQERFRATNSEHERINVLTAFGAWRQPEPLLAALEFTLAQVPDRIRFVPLVAAAANPTAGPTLWQWFEGRIDQLEGFHPMLFERVVAAVVPAAGLSDPARARQFLDDYLKGRPQLGEVAALALEKLEINVRLRQARGGAPG